MIDKKHMSISPITTIQIENILNYLRENDMYSARMGNLTITFRGIFEDTANGRREVFEIQRKVGG